ncbi:MAG: protein kinase [Pyrinomonadaceae bacterium]
MNQDRWHKIETLYHAAQELPPEARADFLTASCSDDAELQDEIESLLTESEQEDSFLSKPTLSTGFSLLASEASASLSGEQIGPYKVLKLLGRGGMGEVYLAEDSRLERLVALKMLPVYLTGETESVLRFQQEARAASGMSHPNIAHIYELGVTKGRHYLAMEYIEGMTLRQMLKHESLSVSEALEIALQVANALAAAHAAGVVHRDIKPENIMVRSDGYAKVLDFGLAKLFEAQDKMSVRSSSSNSGLESTPGLIMGTTAYMSPEQVRGLEVDTRSDIWSLGVVLYEMLAHHKPFEGETASDVTAAILLKEPPLIALPEDAPIVLHDIVLKALSKEKGERYRAAGEMAQDLKQCRQGWNRPEQSTFDWAPDNKTHTGSAKAVARSTAATGTTSRGWRKATTIGLALAAIIVAAAVMFAWDFIRANRKGGSQAQRQELRKPLQSMQFERFTATGKAGDVAAISPDGKYVAHIEADAGRLSLWLKQVGGSGARQLAPPAEVVYWGITFSHDGKRLYYVTKEKNSTIGVLYEVPAQGGESRKLAVNVDGPVALSPDDRQLVFMRRYPVQREDVLIIADADGTGERILATHKFPNSFSFCGPAWSPDGRTIAAGAGQMNSGNILGVVAINVEDGSEKLVSDHQWRSLDGLIWLGDSSGLLVSAAEPNAEAFQIWQLSYPGGEAQRITNDLNDYHSLGITADSRTLVAVQFDHLSSIWTTAREWAEDQAAQISSGKNDGYFGLSWTPDGRIVYGSMVSNKPGIWIMNADGRETKGLTKDAEEARLPEVSPDGRDIFFVASRNNVPHIWRMDIDGNNAEPLTHGSGEDWPSISPDGRHVAYTSVGSANRLTLWRVSVKGEDAVQLTDRLSLKPVISPDGKVIACTYRDAQAMPWKIAIIPFEGGAPLKLFDIPHPYRQIIRWLPDMSGLSYIDSRDGASNIWLQPIDGGKPVQLTNFKMGEIFSYNWSRDGKQLACARGVETRDVTLIKDFR